eukprot:gene10036-27758_t
MSGSINNPSNYLDLEPNYLLLRLKADGRDSAHGVDNPAFYTQGYNGYRRWRNHEMLRTVMVNLMAPFTIYYASSAKAKLESSKDGTLNCQAVGDDGQCAAGSTNCPPGRARRGVNLSPTCQVLPEKTVVSGTRGEKTIGLDDVNSSDSRTRTCQVDTYCPNEYKQGYCSISSAAI